MKKYLAFLLLITAIGCERERRDFKLPNGDQLSASTRLTALQPGAAAPQPGTKNPFENNAFALSEGKRLYGAYNCSGCHAQGGGAIGPALMDHRWIYGGEPDQIFSTIVQGRPNGMPSFGGKIPEQELWQLVAYVQSLSGNIPKAAAPARNDDMQAATPEAQRTPEARVQTGHR